MPFYDYKQDVVIGKETEKEVAKILEEKYGAEILGFNNDNQYDVLVKMDDKEYKYEVKEDFICEKSGNVGLEFSCRGKDSGIVTTKADFYVYKLHTPTGIIFTQHTTKELRKMISHREYFLTVNGGDKGSNSLNYLFKLNVFLSHGKVL